MDQRPESGKGCGKDGRSLFGCLGDVARPYRRNKGGACGVGAGDLT